MGIYSRYCAELFSVLAEAIIRFPDCDSYFPFSVNKES